MAAAEERLDSDQLPEYYDGLEDPRPGERARRWQSWSAGAYLYAKACLEDEAAAEQYLWTSDIEPEPAQPEPRRVPTGVEPDG